MHSSEQAITFIKLGGSIITHKEVPMAVREDVLQRLVAEIARAQAETGSTYILGHGSGSFAHIPATKYRTMEGFISSESRMGMVITHDSAAELNRVVVKACLAAQLPAISFSLSNNTVTAERSPMEWGGQLVLETYLDNGILPVTYGDVLVDQVRGCTIWSTETVFRFLIDQLHQTQHYAVEKVIHVGQVAGVLDQQQQVIEQISEANSQAVHVVITKTKGFDVTGGMWHKIEESLQLADRGIETYVLSGLPTNNVYNALTNHDWIGTRIN